MNANAVKEPRVGLMIHYSVGSYEGTASWCRDPKSGVSYNTLIGPKGQVDGIVPYNFRAWHAGDCKPSSPLLTYRDANSAFEGIALSGGPTFGPVTEAQLASLIRVVQGRFAARGWSRAEAWRITGHSAEAWPRGRKSDPEGDGPTPWLDLNVIRAAL